MPKKTKSGSKTSSRKIIKKKSSSGKKTTAVVKSNKHLLANTKILEDYYEGKEGYAGEITRNHLSAFESDLAPDVRDAVGYGIADLVQKGIIPFFEPSNKSDFLNTIYFLINTPITKYEFNGNDLRVSCFAYLKEINPQKAKKLEKNIKDYKPYKKLDSYYYS